MEYDDEPIRFRGFAQNAASTPYSTTATPFATLRHQGINFVSAGANAPPKQLQQTSPQLDTDQADLQLDNDIAFDDSDEEECEDDEIEDSNLQTNIVVEEDIKTSEKSMASMHIHTSGSAMELDAVGIAATDTGVDSDALPFAIDTEGDVALADAVNFDRKRLVKRASSPAPSDSSEEVIVFHGRSKATVINDPVQPEPTSLPLRQQAPPSQGWGARPSKHDTSERPGNSWSPAPDSPYWKKGKGKGKALPRPDLAPSADEMNKYENMPPKQSKVQFNDAEKNDGDGEGDAEQSIAELQVNWKNTLREKKKLKEVELTGNLKASGSTSSRRKKRGRKKDNRALARSLVSDDDESEAAYEDYMENLKAQLDEANSGDESDVLISHLKATTRPLAISGPSVVIRGEALEDDEVLPNHMKVDQKDVEKEGINFELKQDSEWESDDSELNPDSDELSEDESLNASDLEDDLEYTERQQWEDEDDLRQRRVEALDDETIARLFAKQEELGMDADELLIEDGSYPYISDDGFGDIARARAGLTGMGDFTVGHRSDICGERRGGGNRASEDFFPNASLMADAVEQYGEDGFDIMDFDRPSLRSTKKGRKGQLPPELEALSDEELKGGMAAAWEKDRDKKRQKKLEREERRAEGLLGAAGRRGRADLSKKYPLGMNIHQVWSELAEFMQDEDLNQRAFPPMDKVDRKALHDVAQALGMNSRSQGAGMKRFPVISKTSLTEEYSSDLFKMVINKSARGFYTNRGAARKMKGKAARAASGKVGKSGKSGGGVDAATVRHGEVVGTGAAEIGQNSFGHKLMEKMGWSKGKGLGKDGEGLLVPVEQVMRRGTAGLG